VLRELPWPGRPRSRRCELGFTPGAMGPRFARHHRGLVALAIQRCGPVPVGVDRRCGRATDPT